jgi:hypothetical protein
MPARDRTAKTTAPAFLNAVTMSSAMSGSSSTMRLERSARLVPCMTLPGGAKRECQRLPPA